jgi:hypothetical protein
MRYIAVLLSLSMLFSLSLKAAAQANCQEHQCMAIVDAGSTGSRFHIYAYDLDSTQTPIHITEIWSKKIKPGFASLELNQTTINNYLATLFSGSPESNLPVYFYATAGMRLLPQPKQQQYYTFIQQWFAEQSAWKLRKAKTITGKEEGLYGWLAVNYQLGSLTKKDQELVGVMDMGGASVQIIFPVQRVSAVNSNDVQQFDLYGRHLNLFIHSFLGLGQSEVTHQFLDEASCFVENYELPTGEPASGDAYSCENDISSLMNAVHKVNRTVQPALGESQVNNWFVLGGMAELAKSKPFQFNGEFSIQSLLEQANSQVCHQQWSNLNSLYPDNEYLFGYCLFPAYYYALIVDGYGLQPQQPIQFMTENSDWTLGAVLTQKQTPSLH